MRMQDVPPLASVSEQSLLLVAQPQGVAGVGHDAP